MVWYCFTGFIHFIGIIGNSLVEETFLNRIHDETLLNSTEVTDQEDMNISEQELGYIGNKLEADIIKSGRKLLIGCPFFLRQKSTHHPSKSLIR